MIPTDGRALIAVDLGAESCRVSLLQWVEEQPAVTLVHRFANAPRERKGGLRWNLEMIQAGVEEGIRRCAGLAVEGVRSLAVDGWAVDYVRLAENGAAMGDPFCYRDERTVAAERSLHRRISPERLRELTGVQLLRINTVYQLHADVLAGLAGNGAWLNLPEYLLAVWGGERVAEYTNATHTQMIDVYERAWCSEVFGAAGIKAASAAQVVPPGTVVGRLRGPLAELPGMGDVALVAPACHDTASAVAGIPATGDDWAYISSGTWSLVGTLVEQPHNGPAARADNFTNLGAVGGGVCFHKNVNGMWLIRQCIDAWAERGQVWAVQELVSASEQMQAPEVLLEVDDPELLLAGDMPGRVNAQLRRRGSKTLDVGDAPGFGNLIFHSLAARYAEVLERVAFHSGKRLRRLFVVGGASRNEFLNRLTARTTGLEVIRGAAESSTVGNFAVQLAALDGARDEWSGVYAEHVSRWAGILGNGS